MSTEREFESILAALGERELSDWERQRLWELIAEDEDRLSEYLKTSQMISQLESFGEPNVVPSGIAPRGRAQRWKTRFIAASAAAVVILGAASWAKWNQREPEVVKNEPTEVDPTPEEAYRLEFNAIAMTGSQQRPPTQFISTSSKRIKGKVSFNEDVRPILSENCYACHGPDAAGRKADLRLDTPEGAKAAITAGDPEKSELVIRVFHGDPDEIMPPPDSRKSLKPEERQILARWIAEGAEWQEHWAFIKPNRPDPPEPKRLANWGKNPIDRFVLAKLLEMGMEPNEEASAHLLARRAALDITGLPPDEKLREKFIIDSKPGAYDRYVKDLLESEHAGEHRARFWLDAARYGDTHGMHLDNYREIWPYRDWVISAFNDNMPFDRFLIDQLAGDLLPNPTTQQLIATGFGRCNITTSEGGAIPAELDVRYMIDRVETVSTVFLGLTVGCAVCHDHKFDPISQREVYRLGAFFNNTTQPAMDGNQKDSPPVIVLPKPEFQSEWEKLRALRSRLREELDGLAVDAEKLWAAAVAGIQFPSTIALGDPGEGASEAEDHPAGKRGLRFETGSKTQVETETQVTPAAPFSVSFWIRTPDKVVGTTVLDQTIKVSDKITAGWKITTSVQNALTFQLTDRAGKTIKGLLPGDEALTPRAWQHVVVRYSGGQSNSSITLSVNGEFRRMRNATESYLTDVEPFSAPLKLAPNLPTGGLSDVRIFGHWISNDEVQLLAREFDLLALSGKKWADLDEAGRELAELYAANRFDSAYVAKQAELGKTQLRRDFIYSRSDTTMVTFEREDQKPRAWVLTRGEYDQREDEVAPGVPAVLPPMLDGAPQNRLGLGKWLAHPDHPLTARVMVNRLWQSVFGIGLVKTSEDFGVMGERPINQQLLDWLAAEFVETGWDVNHMLELMVSSAAYRQTMKTDPDRLRKDPENRYLARGPLVRLDAEVLRDQALAIGGLLRRDVGGPSVRPYQPSGLWKAVAFAGSNTREFKADTGAGLYRRSIYTFWKRTSPPASMAAFNAPTRESCTVRRERTNTPLQALVLMNDTQFVEAARALAEQSLKVTSDKKVRAAWMLKTVFSRPANASDLADMVSAAAEFEAMFKADAESAKELIATGESVPDDSLDAAELAAWTMVANTLMNRDDFINKS
ncbi:MAG: mono/diheme cytochrome c family protein [Verrucomicrobiales bacterium]|jgi:mono/diheme cytochrome c family protein